MHRACVLGKGVYISPSVVQGAGNGLFCDLPQGFERGDAITVYGGVSNLTNRQPYVSEFGYPVSPRGAYFFMGVTYNGAAR